TPRRIAAGLATRARGKRLAGKPAATKRRSEQLKVGRRAGESIVWRGSDALRQPPAGAIERGKRVPQFGACGAERRIVRGLDAADDGGEFVQQRPNRGAAVGCELARDKVDRLDAVGAFIDRRNPRVAVILRGAGLLDEAHASVNLHAKISDLVADVGRERLCD